MTRHRPKKKLAAIVASISAADQAGGTAKPPSTPTWVFEPAICARLKRYDVSRVATALRNRAKLSSGRVVLSSAAAWRPNSAAALGRSGGNARLIIGDTRATAPRW